jgi:hypothetical protein
MERDGRPSKVRFFPAARRFSGTFAFDSVAFFSIFGWFGDQLRSNIKFFILKKNKLKQNGR